MRFDLKKPCKDCPFRHDKAHQQGWLGEGRAQEIYNGLLDGQLFPCHKTLDPNRGSDEEFAHYEKHQFCAGALIMLEKEKTTEYSQALRMAMRLRLYHPSDLDLSSPVFDTGRDFVQWHGSKRFKETGEIMSNDNQSDLDSLDDLLDCFDGETVEGGVDSENDEGCEGGACKL